MSELLQPTDEQVAKWTQALANGEFERGPIPGLTDEGYIYPTPQREGPRQVARAEAAQLGSPGYTK